MAGFLEGVVNNAVEKAGPVDLNYGHTGSGSKESQPWPSVTAFFDEKFNNHKLRPTEPSVMESFEEYYKWYGISADDTRSDEAKADTKENYYKPKFMRQLIGWAQEKLDGPLNRTWYGSDMPRQHDDAADSFLAVMNGNVPEGKTASDCFMKGAELLYDAGVSTDDIVKNLPDLAQHGENGRNGYGLELSTCLNVLNAWKNAKDSVAVNRNYATVPYETLPAGNKTARCLAQFNSAVQVSNLANTQNTMQME